LKRGFADNEHVTCHILCSTSSKFPCMRGDLQVECPITRGNYPESRDSETT
jgi:hypothetical protein